MFRRRRPPAEVADLIPEGQRLLAWAIADTGAAVLATDRALVHQDGATPWEAVEKATWESGRLTIAPVDGPPLQWDFGAEETALPIAVRDRVQASIVVAERVDLPGGAALITARRPPRGGSPAWTVIFDSGLDPSDPELQAAATAEVERLRRML
jgi:hypothetical protein